MIYKILWAVGSSNDIEETQQYLEILADKYNAKVYVLSVVPDYINFIETFPENEKNEYTDWVEKKVIPQLENLLLSVAEDFEEKGIDYEMKVKKGIPYKTIIDCSKEYLVDLITLGKGRSGGKNLIGGTALKVLRNSKIPVLCLNKYECSDINRILVPNDLYHLPSINLRYALDFAKPFNSKISQLHILELEETQPKINVVSSLTKKTGEEIIKKLEESNIGDYIDTKVEVDKNAWHGIVNYAQKENTDLIIMTTYSDNKSGGEFLGSTAEKVIQEAHCPVLAITP